MAGFALVRQHGAAVVERDGVASTGVAADDGVGHPVQVDVDAGQAERLLLVELQRVRRGPAELRIDERARLGRAEEETAGAAVDGRRGEDDHVFLQREYKV